MSTTAWPSTISIDDLRIYGNSCEPSELHPVGALVPSGDFVPIDTLEKLRGGRRYLGRSNQLFVPGRGPSARAPATRSVTAGSAVPTSVCFRFDLMRAPRLRLDSSSLS